MIEYSWGHESRTEGNLAEVAVGDNYVIKLSILFFSHVILIEYLAWKPFWSDLERIETCQIVD